MTDHLFGDAESPVIRAARETHAQEVARRRVERIAADDARHRAEVDTITARTLARLGLPVPTGWSEESRSAATRAIADALRAQEAEDRRRWARHLPTPSETP